jgi:hydrogenase maturation protease
MANRKSMKAPVVVLGLGNPLMGDEGIGVYLIEPLARSAAEHPSVEFIDAGTGGLAVLHYLQGRRKAILIDCALMGESPGAIKRFTPGEVQSTNVLAHQSLHEADLLRITAMAERLGQAPEQIVIFGIQPERVEPGQGLSQTLRNRIGEYLSAILHEIATTDADGHDRL